MMYCSNCGTQITEGSSFCGHCGTNVADMTGYTNNTMEVTNMNNSAIYNNQVYNTQVSARQESMNELTRMYNYFSVKSSEYDELDRLAEHVDYLKRYSRKGMLVWGIILGAVGLFFLMLAAAYSSGGLAVFNVILMGVGVMLIFLYAHKKKSVQKSIAEEERRVEEIASELADYYYNYGYCQIGLEYTYPSSIDQIYSVIREGRADSIKEAINVLNDDAHKSTMESLQRQTAQAAWQTCAASRAAAGFAAANFFYQVRN